MKTIWKFKIETPDEKGMVRINLPIGAQILTVQAQFNRPLLWALVDPEAGFEWRTLYVIGTGWDSLDTSILKYISSFQLDGGKLVFHVFVLREAE